MDYAQMRAEKEERYKVYCEKYEAQLDRKRWIENLEGENKRLSEAEPTKWFEKRRLKKLMKINLKDINKYKKELSQMEALPEFK